MNMMSPERPAVTRSGFDRLAELPQRERRAYNLIVEGRGDSLLLDEQERLHAPQRGIDHPDASMPTLKKRYLAGAQVLSRLRLGLLPDPVDASDKPSLVVLPSDTASVLTIVFSGNNTEFALPAHLLHKQDTHLILIHDRLRCFALAGLAGIGRDYAESLAGIARIIDALQPERVVVIGISAGGAGAIKFACDLAVSRLLCFSVPTTLDLTDDPGAELRQYPQLAKLYRTDRSLGIDLAAYYRSCTHAPPATFVYSPGHQRDAWLALRMSGIEGVTLLTTDGYTGHTTYRWLIMENKIGAYLDWAYTDLPGSLAIPADRRPAAITLYNRLAQSEHPCGLSDHLAFVGHAAD